MLESFGFLTVAQTDLEQEVKVWEFLRNSPAESFSAD